jgi:tetratricopeptide (TPR) repeat protein
MSRGPISRGRWLAAALLLSSAASAQQPTAAAPADQRALRAAAKGGSVRALLELAELAAREGDFAAAGEPLRQALELAPNSERVLHTYARVAMVAGAPGQALLALEPLARIHPTVVEYTYLTGVARIQVGDPVEAEVALERARQLEPHRALTLAALGTALNDQKRYAEAKKVLEHALPLTGDDAQVLAVLAESAAGLGEHALAESHAKRVLERAPRHPRAQLVLGIVHMQQERYAEARAWFEGALAADSALVKAHYQLSLACARLDDRACAEREVGRYQEVLRTQREMADALPRLSLENLRAGNLPP